MVGRSEKIHSNANRVRQQKLRNQMIQECTEDLEILPRSLQTGHDCVPLASTVLRNIIDQVKVPHDR